MYVGTYRYHEGLDANDLRELTKKFGEVGAVGSVIAHCARLDGSGGIIVQEASGDPERDFEVTIQYGPRLELETTPVTTMEDAFPVIQRVYG